MLPEVVALIAIFIAIGGQYALLFQLYRIIVPLAFEMRACPYHVKKG